LSEDGRERRGDGYFGEDHIFLQPNRSYTQKPKPRGGFPPSDYHSGEEAPPLEEQFEETIFAIESIEPFDKMAYYVLDLRVSRRHPLVSRFTEILKAKILSEVNDNELLVTSSIDDLKSAKSVFLKTRALGRQIFKIHYLRLKDIVDPELDLKDAEGKTLTLHLVPNIGVEKANEYMNQLENYFTERGISILDYWIEDEIGDAFLDAFLTKEQLSNLTNKFGFIFKVHEKVKIRSIEPIAEESLSEFTIEPVDKENWLIYPKYAW